jgi:hypothetical protein
MEATITITIDLDKLHSARENAGLSEEEVKEESTEEAVRAELGWVAESGISVKSISIH